MVDTERTERERTSMSPTMVAHGATLRFLVPATKAPDKRESRTVRIQENEETATGSKQMKLYRHEPRF